MKIKKILSILISAIMIAGLVPIMSISAFAAPEEVPDYFYIKNVGTVSATITWRDAINDTVANLDYSVNDKNSFEKFGGSVELAPDDICYFKGTNTKLSEKRVECSTKGAAFAIGGDIGTLINCTGNISEYPDYAFSNVFFRFEALTDISDLTVCRKDTKFGIRSLAGMFTFCKGLTEIPENFLPATTLSEGCYMHMFAECVNLSKVPKDLLPAKVLEKECYYGMFSDCKELENAPDLPAEQLYLSCCGYMFDECSSLSSIEVAFTKWGSTGELTSFYFLPHNVNDTLTICCPYGLDTDSRGDYSIPDRLSVNVIRFCKMHLFAAGGIGGEDSIAPVYGEAMPEISVPVREGYSFEGYFDPDGVKYYNGDGTSARNWDKVEATATLCAIWSSLDSDRITVKDGEVYDLDGAAITASSALIENGGEIKDSTGGCGILKVDREALYGKNFTDQFPLYDTENGGWRFFDCEIGAGYIEGEVGLIGTTLKFKDEQTEQIAKGILLSDNPGMSLDITLSETDENGVCHTQSANAPESVIEEYAKDTAKPILMGVSNLKAGMAISVNYRFENGLVISKAVSNAAPYITLDVGSDRSYIVKVFGNGLNGTVIVAVYNSENEKELLNVTIEQVAELSGTVQSGGKFVKSMLWNNSSDMIPICDPVGKTVVE